MTKVRALAFLATLLLAVLAGCAMRPAASTAPEAPTAEGRVLELDPDRFAGGAAGRLRVVVAWPARAGQAAGERRVQDFTTTTTSFRLTVAASDMVQVVGVVARPAGAATASAQITVPAGTARSLLAEGLNAGGRVTARGASDSITIQAGADTRVSVQLATIVGDVRGTATNLGTGLPAANLAVDAGGATASTDASGSYTLKDVPKGTQVLRFGPGPIVTQPIVVTAGAVTDAAPVGVSLGYGETHRSAQMA
ncbi:MAG: hypothetical protein FJZ01_08595 [Candidatus Sericytochromatia bacterium]|nr:hypothetical protein [Candidatus Tanganyikabacteria bacterium]